jgi:Ricin-type beta-trefoil lectin domain/Lysozyme like domain
MKRQRCWAGAFTGLALTVATALAPAVTASAAVTHPARVPVAGGSFPKTPEASLRTPGYEATISEAQTCAEVAAKAGFSFNNYLNTNNGGSYPVIVVAVAVGMAESSCNASATNGPNIVGMWQIEYAAHNISLSCAQNAQCNADAAFNISDKGYDWCAWSTYAVTPSDCSLPSGYNYTQFLSAAEAGVYGYTFQLKSQGNGTCLDADGSKTGNGDPIFQYSCNSSDRYQQWEVVGSDGDVPILKNVGAGTCLDADSAKVGNGGTIFQWGCNQSDHYQQWWFYGSGNTGNDNAVAGVHSVGASGYCLDADGSKSGNGAPIFQWGCNQSDSHQQWN